MNAIARMMDANLNRAREGLRVMEDVARFVLDSGELCSACKELRHRLQEIAVQIAASNPGLDSGGLLANRDTPGDVGTGIGTEQEYRRTTVGSVVMAAGGRCSEALRVIEESAKIASPSGDETREVERIRYAVYDLQRRIVLAIGCPWRVQWRLCVLLTESLCLHHAWRRVAELAIEGGADCIQLREKSLTDSELLRRARVLVEIGRAGGAAIVVNDRPDVAILAGASGVHVGQGDLPIVGVRRLAGFSLLVGVSTSTMSEARLAVAAGADVCGVGPMFPTTTKQKPVLAGPGYLREYLEEAVTAAVPHLAIGGIGLGNIEELAAAGCRGIAVSSCVCSAPDPAEVCRVLRRELTGAHGEPAPPWPSASTMPGSPTA